MKWTSQIWQLNWLAGTVIFFAAVTPQTAVAHGEVLIQIGLVTQKIQAKTNDAQLYLDRAELHREHKDWNAAKSDYDRAAHLNPNLPDLDLSRAKMLDDAGELKASRKLFDKILKRTPDHGEAFMGRARVLVKLGERKKAIADFQRSLDLLPSPPPEYFLELAQTFFADENIKDSLHTLDRGIQKYGPLIPLQSYALELELKQKNHDAALARVDTLIARASRKENLLAQRGEILLAANRSDDARKAFEASLEAIKILPVILQKAPPMQKLQARIHFALAGMTNACATTETEFFLNAKNEN